MAKTPQIEQTNRLTARSRRERGAEMLEFTLVFLPFLMLVFVLLDTAWAVFAKSTLEHAVRAGARSGVTITAAQAAPGACLTDMVKNKVQENAMGLLSGQAGLDLVKVHYLQPPPPQSTAPATDVSNQANGNASGNIMQVSVENYSLVPLVPRIFGWNQAADNSPLVLSVYSSDLIEPTRNPACIGLAP